MDPLVKELRHNPMLWLLATAKLVPTAHTLLFALSVLAIVPLAALLGHATESVAEKTGDTVGGLLNATLGNLTELVIAAAALRAGEYALVKGSIAGAIVTNTLFMLGASFVLGGLKHHIQEFNRATARLDAGLLFLATIALISPSAIAKADLVSGAALTQKLSVALAVLLVVGYGLGLLFSLGTHREIFASTDHAETREPAWPIRLALVTLVVVTVLVALVSEIFVESVQKAAETFGMSQAFVGFIVVALVGGAAEMAVAFSAARKNRLDLSVGIALGSASQIALFVAPVLICEQSFWPQRRTRPGPIPVAPACVAVRLSHLANGHPRQPPSFKSHLPSLCSLGDNGFYRPYPCNQYSLWLGGQAGLLCQCRSSDH
jgi:Ca2+:H+ antiporter